MHFQFYLSMLEEFSNKDSGVVWRQTSDLSTLSRRRNVLRILWKHVPGAIFKHHRPEKQIRGGWRPSFWTKTGSGFRLRMCPAISWRSRRIWTGPRVQSGPEQSKQIKITGCEHSPLQSLLEQCAEPQIHGRQKLARCRLSSAQAGGS